MCTVWPSHSNDWASRATNLHQILHQPWTFLHRNYLDDSEGCSYGQLMIGSFIMTTCHSYASCLVQFFGETSNHPPYSPVVSDSASLQSRFGTPRLLTFPKIKITFEREDFRPLMRFRKIWWGSWWPLGELCEVLRCLLWRGLRRHCPVYKVSCILHLLQEMSLFFILYGWILSAWPYPYMVNLIFPPLVTWSSLSTIG